MNKTEELKKELEKIGVSNTKELREAMKKMSLDVSLMVADIGLGANCIVSILNAEAS